MDREDIKKLLKDCPFKIGHFAGFNDLTGLHNDWLKSFLYSKDNQTLLAHRGSYKTTDLSLFLALHPLIHPNQNVIFFRKTDTDVIEVIRQSEKILDLGCVKKIIFDLYGIDLMFVKRTDSEFSTNLCTSARGVSQVVGLGIGTSITGKHADIVVTDDIVNLKDRISRAERERTKLQYMELQNICNRGGRFINTGTPWHKEDAISIMPNVIRYDCYSTGLIDREVLEEIRQSMTPSLFAANYELKHIADTDALFGNPGFTDQEDLIHNGICHIDAAYGGSDSTAFTIMNECEGKLITFGKRYNKHVDECLDEILSFINYYKAGTIYCEDNADKGYLKKEIRSRGRFASGYHEGTNKYIKISTYLKKNWKDIKFLESTDHEYISQILDYTENAEHDDCPDSCASIVRQIRGKQQSKLNRNLKGGV